jgi:hypothetical protein
MAASPLGRAFIEVLADLAKFPTDLRAKLMAALKEGTAGIDFKDFEDKAAEAGDVAGDRLADELEKKTESRMKGSGEKSGRSFLSGLGGVFSAIGPMLLPLLIAFGVEAAAALLPAVYALGAALPGAIAGAVVGAGALMLAFHGVGGAIAAAFSGDPAKLAEAMQKLAPAAREVVTEIASLKSQFTGLQQAVQQAFFVQLEGSIKRLVTTLLPTLQAGLSAVASDLGRMGAGLATALGGSKGDLAAVFAGAHAALQPLIPLLGQMVAAFIKLAAQAAPFITVLSQGLAGGLEHLVNAINLAAANGGLQRFFADGLIALHQFGSLLSSVLGLVSTLLGALATAGGPALGVLGAIVNELNAFFSSAEGKDALIIVFDLLNNVLQSLAQIIQPLLPVVGRLISALGTELINAVYSLTPALVDVAKALVPLLDAVIPLLPVVSALAVGLSSIIQFLARYPGLIQAVLVGLAAWKLAMMAIDTYQAIFIAEEAATPWGLIILAIAAIVAGITLLVTHWKQVTEIASEAWNAIVGGAKAAWGWVKDAAGAIADFFTQIGQFFYNLPGQILNFLASLPGQLALLFQQALEGLAYIVGEGIGLVIREFFVLPQQIWDALSGLGKLLWQLFTDAWNLTINTTVALAEQLVGFVRALPGRLWGLLTSLPGLIGGVFRSAWNAAYDAVVSAGERIISFALSLPGKLVGFMRNVGSDILGGLKDGINGVIRAFNSGIDKAAGPLHILIPHIPQLARGGIIDEPTLAVLGERNREVVLPTDDPERARQLIMQSGLANLLAVPQGQPNITVYATFGPNGEMLDVIDQRVENGLDGQATAMAHGTRQ